MFILSFISSSLEFQSVNHASIYEVSELKGFEKNFYAKYLIIEQMTSFEQMYKRLLNHIDNHC